MSRPTTLPDPWAGLARAFGGVSRLARYLGVDRRTISKWAMKEREPDELRKRDIKARLRRRGHDSPWSC